MSGAEPIPTTSTRDEPEGAPATSRSMRGAVLRGSAVTFVGYGASMVVRLASNVIVTRLLVPGDFGLMALVNVFLIGLTMLSDVGIGPSIIQNPRGDEPTFLNTAWTVQLVRGGLIWLASCAVAMPVATFYEKPELLQLIPVAGLAAAITGAESTRLFTLNRHLALGRITILELASQALGSAVSIGASWAWHSVWALVAGGVAGALAKTVLSHVALPGIKNRPAWEAEARASLFGFGRWIFVSTAITYLSGQSDRLVLGKLISTESLGIYATAATLAALPSQVVNQLSGRVFYPAVARMMAGERGDLTAIRDARARLLLLAAPFFGLGIALVGPIASILYDRRYDGVGVIATALSIATWLNAVSLSYGVVLLAAGHPKFISFGTAAKTALFAALVWPITRRFGVTGAALLMSGAELAVTAIAFVGCRPLRVTTPGSDLVASLVVGVSALSGAGIYLAAFSVSRSVVTSVAAVAIVAAAVAYSFRKKLRMP
jgi:O-antigen/teichoic acid export membrane protein